MEKGNLADRIDTAVRFALPDVEFLAGPSMRRRILDDLEGARRSVRVLTANLKAAQIGRRRDIVDLLALLAGRGVSVQILASSTTGILRERLADKGAADLPLLDLRICPRNHAKAFVVDDDSVSIGSANLTGKGLGAMASEDSINVELMLRTCGKNALALRTLVLDNLFEPLWQGRLCPRCLRKKKGQCDGLLDKFQILDLGPG